MFFLLLGFFFLLSLSSFPSFVIKVVVLLLLLCLSGFGKYSEKQHYFKLLINGFFGSLTLMFDLVPFFSFRHFVSFVCCNGFFFLVSFSVLFAFPSGNWKWHAKVDWAISESIHSKLNTYLHVSCRWPQLYHIQYTEYTVHTANIHIVFPSIVDIISFHFGFSIKFEFFFLLLRMLLWILLFRYDCMCVWVLFAWILIIMYPVWALRCCCHTYLTFDLIWFNYHLVSVLPFIYLLNLNITR